MNILPFTKTQLVAICLCFCVQPIVAEDWTQFRGPRFGTTESSLPVRWSVENVAWKTELPGPGGSSPVVFEDHIYLTCYTGYGVARGRPGDPKKLERHLICFNKSNGKIVWRKTVGAKSSKNEYTQWAVALHGYSSSTPVVDETGVYVFMGDAGCIAYDHQGKRRWTFDCGQGTHKFGSGASPLLYGDLLIVNACPESGDLIAINKATGKQVWRQSGINESWGTPVIYKNTKGSDELAISIKGAILAFNPKDGKPLWNCQSIKAYICPSIVAHNGALFALGGKTNRAVAVRSGGSGNVSETHKLWELSKGTNVGSPVVHKGHLYWAKDNGVLYCANIESGKIEYEERVVPDPGKIYASPILSGGNLYYVSRKNGTFVVAAKPKFELLAHNVIKGDKSVFNASPVPGSGGVLLRSDKYLYCIRNK